MTGHRQRHEGEHRTMMGWVCKKPFMGDRKVSALVLAVESVSGPVRLMADLVMS